MLKRDEARGGGRGVSAAPVGACSVRTMIPTAEAVGYSLTPSRLRRASPGKPADEVLPDWHQGRERRMPHDKTR
jgi:hypothetical protein